MKGMISEKYRIELRKQMPSTTDAQVCRRCGALLSDASLTLLASLLLLDVDLRHIESRRR